MLSNFKYVILILFILVLQSCTTYKTFYSESYNSVQQVPQKKILRLDLSNQNLKDVPEGFSKLTNLKMLNISGNMELNLAAVFDAVFSPEKIEVLILNDLSLQELPENIKRFTNLKQLSLNENPELDWSQTFQEIRMLPIRFLNLQHNNLSGLPKEISEIQTLRDLNLSHNKITEGALFTHLSLLPKLYSLWLSYNEMRQLPVEIGLLEHVNNLYIGNNELESLPDEMKTMKQVWVVQAEHNNFISVPEVFIKMPALFSVHLNNCKIAVISEVFALEKYSMRGLLLDNNKLSEAQKKQWRKRLNNFFLLSIE